MIKQHWIIVVSPQKRRARLLDTYVYTTHKGKHEQQQIIICHLVSIRNVGFPPIPCWIILKQGKQQEKAKGKERKKGKQQERTGKGQDMMCCYFCLSVCCSVLLCCYVVFSFCISPFFDWVLSFFPLFVLMLFALSLC